MFSLPAYILPPAPPPPPLASVVIRKYSFCSITRALVAFYDLYGLSTSRPFDRTEERYLQCNQFYNILLNRFVSICFSNIIRIICLMQLRNKQQSSQIWLLSMKLRDTREFSRYQVSKQLNVFSPSFVWSWMFVSSLSSSYSSFSFSFLLFHIFECVALLRLHSLVYAVLQLCTPMLTTWRLPCQSVKRYRIVHFTTKLLLIKTTRIIIITIMIIITTFTRDSSRISC